MFAVLLAECFHSDVAPKEEKVTRVFFIECSGLSIIVLCFVGVRQ